MAKAELPQLSALKGLRLVLGVCGGIAAYKSAELLRLLLKQGCDVQVVMTEGATQFVTPLTFQALSGKPVHLSQWPGNDGQRGMPHIDLSRHADALLIAPCTANSMAKYAHGLANNLLDNLVLARKCPVLLAPAMNVEMWNNPATQRNLATLGRDGFHILGPAQGEQACGETGAGRMLEPDEIVFELARVMGKKPLAGQQVVVTAGPTFEPIDPVRGITNRSSGKMGYAIAQAAWLAGAQVHLVSGPSNQIPPYGVGLVAVQTAREMLQATQPLVESAQVFIGVAAVADYGVKNPSQHKQKKTADGPAGLQIEFELNPDILATVGELAHSRLPGLTVVGFAAETENLEQYAQRKLHSKKAHLIVGNLAQDALGADDTLLTLFEASRTTPLPRCSKLQAASLLIEHIATLRAH